MSINSKTIAAHTLGCKVNQLETEAIVEAFRLAGYRVVDFTSPADVYLINTCTVTHLADRKSRQMIRRAQRINPAALIVATGCYAQNAPETLNKIPGLSLIWGTKKRAEIVNQVKQLLAQKKEAPLTFGETKPANEALIRVEDIRKEQLFEELPLVLDKKRTRAFIKIQDGCNQFCSYCIIPYTRGPVRSRPVSRIVEEIRLLVEAGYQEVVLTGIHTSAYGKEWQQGGNPTNLATLVEKILCEVPALSRLRISSIEPTEMPAALIAIMAQSKVICRHLHIPLQSGDEEILQRMRRPYTPGQYAALLQKLHDNIPGLAVTTDVMVGFPGETEQHFSQGLAFVQAMNFSDLHVFKYSARHGTPASRFTPMVNASEKEARSKKMTRVAENLRKRFASSFIGQTLEVLFEEEAPSPPGFDESDKDRDKIAFLGGYTDNYLRVVVPADKNTPLQGQFATVRIVGVQDGLAVGKIS